jgi:prepilin signal peptidase PulO-like enzyme (type II secretory pathway)
MFGSFSTVLIERWYNRKSGIMFGRSECPNCDHTLGGLDLIPIVSYALSRGRCRYCRIPISGFYPLAEIVMWLIFWVITIVLLQGGIFPLSLQWAIWYFFWFVTGVYVLYDIKYMEIPDQILVPGIWISLILLIFASGTLSISDHTFHTDTNTESILSDHIWAAVAIYSFFYLQILIPGVIHCIKNNQTKSIIELIVWFFILPILITIDLFRSSDSTRDDAELEIPTWIGWWDLRIALFIGLTLGTVHSLTTLIIAYVSGSIIGIGLLLHQKFSKKETTHQIAFGPFLWFWWIMSILFYAQITDIVSQYYIL